jgi:hypothetical protein
MMRPLVLALLSGCAATTSPFERLSRDARGAIYDRENDVVIARSRKDEAERGLQLLHEERNELKRRFGREQARLKKSGGHAAEAQVPNDRRLEYLVAQERAFDGVLRHADTEIAAARARLELTRHQQLVRFGMEREAVLSSLQADVKSAEQRATLATRRELELKGEAQKRFAAWKSAEEAYVNATGDFDSGVWVD